MREYQVYTYRDGGFIEIWDWVGHETLEDARKAANRAYSKGWIGVYIFKRHEYIESIPSPEKQVDPVTMVTTAQLEIGIVLLETEADRYKSVLDNEKFTGDNKLHFEAKLKEVRDKITRYKNKYKELKALEEAE